MKLREKGISINYTLEQILETQDLDLNTCNIKMQAVRRGGDCGKLERVFS